MRTFNEEEEIMLPSQYFQIMVWINVNVCCPLIFSVIFLCFVVRLDHIPVTYYINLLIFNLIQIIILTFCMQRIYHFYYNDLSKEFFLYCCSGVGSVCFRMIFAAERSLFLCRPQFDFIRKMRGFVTFCAWVFSIVLFLVFFFDVAYTKMLFLIFTGMFFICLVATIMSICTPTLDRAEEKCRVVGSLVILLVNYAALIPSAIVILINIPLLKMAFTLMLHCPLIDFLLLFFISKGPFIQLLMCLCCSRRRNPAEEERSTSAVRQDRLLSSDTLRVAVRQGDQV